MSGYSSSRPVSDDLWNPARVAKDEYLPTNHAAEIDAGNSRGPPSAALGPPPRKATGLAGQSRQGGQVQASARQRRGRARIARGVEFALASVTMFALAPRSNS